VARHFKSLADYSLATGQDQHSVLVDYDIFVNAKIPDKSDPQRLYDPENFDFRLKPGSAAVDAGIILPTINDHFTGKAPDLGAYELDRPLPHYGPRSWPLTAPDSSAPRSITGPLHQPRQP
jgi:hypothetical protein